MVLTYNCPKPLNENREDSQQFIQIQNLSHDQLICTHQQYMTTWVDICPMVNGFVCLRIFQSNFFKQTTAFFYSECYNWIQLLGIYLLWPNVIPFNLINMLRLGWLKLVETWLALIDTKACHKVLSQLAK